MNAAKTDAKELLDELLPFATQMLQENHEFVPFGGQMAPDGGIIQVDVGEGNNGLDSSALVQRMQGFFREEAQAERLRTCGVFFDVETVPPGETETRAAIAAAVDHHTGYSVVMVYPYGFDENGDLILGASYAMEGQYSIFGRPAGGGE